MASLASLEFHSAQTAGRNVIAQQASLAKARQWNVRRTEIGANDADAFYYLGVINWSECFPEIQAERMEQKLSPDDPGPLQEGGNKERLRTLCNGKIQTGIEDLRRVLELDPESEDAKSYLNLSFRLKAAIAGSGDEARSLVETAEEWANKSLETKRKKAEQRRPSQ